MKRSTKTLSLLVVLPAAVGLFLVAASLQGADWPQWLGAERDGKAADFKVPKTWPEKLTQKWKTTVGQGDASPALVGDHLYVFTRQGGDEMVLCLDATTGKEKWTEKYPAEAAKEPMGRHPGPRSSPAVDDGKVLAYGVRGALTCVDATSGKLVWQKSDFEGTWPRFFTSSSPMIEGGLCIAQLGGEGEGGIVAYDPATGAQKWKWTGDGTAYASPTGMTVGGTKMVVAMTAKKVVGLSLVEGTLLWETPFEPQGRAYNAATPIVNGETVIFAGSGRGTKAVKIEKTDAGFAVRELWSNGDNAVQFNTPVLKDGRLYGLSQKGNLFCLDAKEGKTLWTSSLGGGGFGSVVDAGSVLMALTPDGELKVYEPSDKEYKQLASYKVADNATYACPVPTRKGIYIKDQDSVMLFTVE